MLISAATVYVPRSRVVEPADLVHHFQRTAGSAVVVAAGQFQNVLAAVSRPCRDTAVNLVKSRLSLNPDQLNARCVTGTEEEVVIRRAAARANKAQIIASKLAPQALRKEDGVAFPHAPVRTSDHVRCRYFEEPIAALGPGNGFEQPVFLFCVIALVRTEVLQLVSEVIVVCCNDGSGMERRSPGAGVYETG